MKLLRQLYEKIKEPKPIYSRNKSKAELKGILQDGEDVIFGIDLRDSYISAYRNKWFLTETKLVFISKELPLDITREIYLFNQIEEMKIFEDESIFVIVTEQGRQGFELDSDLKKEFADQAILQFELYTDVVSQSE